MAFDFTSNRDIYMHYSKFLKVFFISIATSSLMACSGGGEEKKATPTPVANLTLDISKKSIQIDEETSGTITFSVSYSGSKALTYNVIGDGTEGISVTQTDKELILTVSDMTQLINNATVKLDVTDGSVSDSDSLNVSIINTSFFAARDNLIESLGGVKDFADNDIAAYNSIVFLTDVDVKTGLLPQDSLGSEIERRGDAINTASSKLSEDVLSLITSLNDYNSESEGSDSDLVAYTEKTQDAIDSYIIAIDSVFLDVRITGGNVLPKIRFTSLSETGDSYSLFIGNTSMGSNDSGTWSFSENYAFLDSIINSNVCYAI
jgi:hypothetical protein